MIKAQRFNGLNTTMIKFFNGIMNRSTDLLFGIGSSQLNCFIVVSALVVISITEPSAPIITVIKWPRYIFMYLPMTEIRRNDE